MSPVASPFAPPPVPLAHPQTLANHAFVWPTPPYACYAEAGPPPAVQTCEVEGGTGHSHHCLLAGLNVAGRTALIQIPSGRTAVPLRFSAIRRITLTAPLAPRSPTAEEAGGRHAHDVLLDYRARLSYRLELADGSLRQGETVGHVETAAGLFLFPPLDAQDRVQRVFYPREAYRTLQVGERLGEVLLAHQVVTEDQVAQAVQEQDGLRGRKLGDYLVSRNIVSPEQLLQALEHQARMPVVRVGEALLALGLVTQAQIDEALEQQKRDRSIPLGELLVRSGRISRRDLQMALARKMGFPVVDVHGFPIDPNALRQVPPAVARRLNVLPLLAREHLLVAAAADPSSRATIEELEFVTQTKVLTALAGEPEEALAAVVDQAYARVGHDEPPAADAPAGVAPQAPVAQEPDSPGGRKLGEHLVVIVSPEPLLQALEHQARMPVVRVGEALLALGLVTQAQIDEALEQQKHDRSIPLGELLVRSGRITRRDLQMALARKMGFPLVDVHSFPIDANALRQVPFAVARRLNVLPLLAREHLLVVAAEDPSLRAAIEELEFVTQTKVLPVLAGEREGALAEVVAQAYARVGRDEAPPAGGERRESLAPGAASRLLESLELQSADEDAEAGPPIEQSDNSLVLLINAMIIEAHRQGVSDIHIETFHTRRKVRIRFRKDGMLVPYMELPHTYRAALIARLKVMCDLDITERRQPQDGKIDFARFSEQHRIELRVATIPTQGGAEDVVLRILSSARPLPLARLGLSTDNLQQLREAVDRPYGMVLCVGPTGSGKTTTLHSVLQHLNTPQRKIWTAENPIEITNPDLRQVQVNPKIGWSFDKALRTFLRADPDVIMVGEIRDQETAQVAVEASLTGHLILSTLHTNSAPETITRLLDMGLNPFNFADSLLAVLAQRLVRQLCEACRYAEPASEADIDLLLQEYLHAFPADDRPTPEALRAQWLERFGVQGRLLRHHAPGCPACTHSGYRGRLGLHELLMVEADIRHLIMTGASPDQLRHSAMRHGHFRTLRQDGIEKVLAGRTSLAEVRANCNV